MDCIDTIERLIEEPCILSVEYENSKRVKYIAQIDSKNVNLLNSAKENISLSNLEELDLLGNKKNSFAFIKDEKIHEVEFRFLDKQMLMGLHELLTASILLANETIFEYKEYPLELLKIIDRSIESGKIIGEKELPNIFTENFYNILSQSLSAAKIIKNIISNNRIDKIYLTDSYWHDDIKRFQIERHGMKRYNSADIVIKCKDIFYGISLKRKKYVYEKDPPFLNKSFKSILSGDPVHSHILEEYQENENAIFSFIVDKALKENIISIDGYSGEWKQYISKIDNKYINLCLQNNPVLQKFCKSVFLENSDLKKLLYTIALRNDIKDLENDNFYFYTVLGIGNVKNDRLEVFDGEIINKSEKDLDISVRYNGRYSSGIICYI